MKISGFHIDSSQYGTANISENTKVIYRFLVNELNLNHAAVCGVLTNIQHESNFNQNAVGDGGTCYGICQWHNGRFQSLMSYCQKNHLDYNTLEGQLSYLKEELENNYTGVLDSLLDVPDTEQGSYDAAYYWCVHFEVPNHTYERATQRGNPGDYSIIISPHLSISEGWGFSFYKILSIPFTIYLPLNSQLNSRKMMTKGRANAIMFARTILCFMQISSEHFS